MGSAACCLPASGINLCCISPTIMKIFFVLFPFFLTACTGVPFPQGLTLSEFRQEGRSLEDKADETSVIISRSYAKVIKKGTLLVQHSDFDFQIRRQGRKGFTELFHHAGTGAVEKTYETDLETKNILASIDDINNALIGDPSIKKSDTEEESEARDDPSKNVFQNLWDQILG